MATLCSVMHENASFDSMFPTFGRGGTKHGAPDQFPSSVKPYEANPVLGAAATEEAMAAMCSIIHKKVRFVSMFAILGRGGTKHGAPDELPSSVKPCEFDLVLGA